MRIGIDLGGSKIEIAVLDAMGRTLHRRRVRSPSHDYAAVVETVARLALEAEAKVGSRCSVGIGTPGTVSRTTGLMKNANSTILIGRAFERDVAARLGREIRIANDADCFVLSETVDGAAIGATCAFGIILGTGVGGGIAVGGRLSAGPSGIAGEWGHNPLPWARADELPGPQCYCGKSGCIETFLSGPAVTRDHVAHGGPPLEARDVAVLAAGGNAAAGETLLRYTDRLSRGLASVINVLDPEVIVCGGGLSNVDMLYTAVPVELKKHIFSDTVAVRFVRAAHGDSSGVRGAAWLWPAT